MKKRIFILILRILLPIILSISMFEYLPIQQIILLVMLTVLCCANEILIYVHEKLNDEVLKTNDELHELNKQLLQIAKDMLNKLA